MSESASSANTYGRRIDAVPGTASGVRFVERHGGAVSDGRYQSRVTRG
jgi:hypothetical protein